MRIFKVIAVLLTYPSGELVAALPEIRTLISKEEALPTPLRKKFSLLIDSMERERLLDLQARYVQHFDQTPALCLHLFDHNFGDERERGQAMVELRQIYAKHGLEATRSEVPDFLPMICEFLSTVDPSIGMPLLADTTPILEKIESELINRNSPYAALLGALLHLSGVESANSDEIRLPTPKTPKPDVNARSMEAIDDDWEERPVTFGFDAPETLAPLTPLVSPASLVKQTHSKVKQEDH